RQDRRVQTPIDRRRLLEERLQSPAAAAPLRHRLLQREGPRYLPAPARGGQETRSPCPRQATEAVHHLADGGQRTHPVDAEGSDRGDAEGRAARRPPGVVQKGGAAEGRLPAGLPPAHWPSGAVPHQRTLSVLPGPPFPADVLPTRGRGPRPVPVPSRRRRGGRE